jgi:hypothetical protein
MGRSVPGVGTSYNTYQAPGVKCENGSQGRHVVGGLRVRA